MAARLGNVIYWFACAAAALLILGLPLGIFYNWATNNLGQVEYGLVGAVMLCGVAVWLIGRAFKYILAGS